MKRVSTAVASLGAWLCVTGACRPERAPATAPGAADRPLVELFSWWTAPGEEEALEALIDTHKRAHPEARIFNAAIASGAEARTDLFERLARNDPPDLFQEYVHDLRATVSNAEGRRMPLDDLFDRLRLRQAFFPDVLREVTRDGRILAMPVNLHRENTLLYNRRILEAHHIAPPATVAELLAACKALKAAGVVPVATAAQGWILRIMFNALAAGTMGSARYRDYFSGKDTADLGPLRAAIHTFGEVMRGYVNPDASEEGFGWTSAAQAVYHGDAAMILHGDWVKGYFVQLGWRPDVDFGVVPAPGAADLFLYGIDVFALSYGARNERGARELLATIASTPGQVAFNRLKGSTPIRHDVDRADLDSVGRATLQDFEHASVRMLVPSRPVWEDALYAFARDHDEGRLLRAFVDAPPGP
jgi:glucose/mannose transport system substrate-binding protein